MKEQSDKTTKIVKKTIAIITGASSGVGRQFAHLLDDDPRLSEIWLCARREERLNSLAKKLETKARVIAGDVTDPNWCHELKQAIEVNNVEIHTLINSAGFGKFDSFANIANYNQRMVEVNCWALTAITSLCLPYMKNGGRIINIASVAGFMPQYNAAVYAASKSYVLNLSRALNQELKERNITVTAVCPNPMPTEFFDVAGVEMASNPMKQLGMEDVEGVCRKALQRSEKGKDISVYSFMAKLVHFASLILPHRLVLWFERKAGF